MNKLHYFFIFFILFSSCKKDKINPSSLPKKVTVTNIDNEVSCIIYFSYDNKNRLSKEIIHQTAYPETKTYTFGYVDDQIQVKYNNGIEDFTFTYIVDVQTKKILKRINTFNDNSYKYVYEYKPESQQPFSLYYFNYDNNNNLNIEPYRDLEFNGGGQCSTFLTIDSYVYIHYGANKDEFGINTTLHKFRQTSNLTSDPYLTIDNSSEPLFIGLTGYTFYNSEILIDYFNFESMNSFLKYNMIYQFDNDKLVNYSSIVAGRYSLDTIINNKVVIEYN